MCRIERYDVVYPDGRRESRERVVNCPRGTRTRPCEDVEIHALEDDHAAPRALVDSDSTAAGPPNHEKPTTKLDGSNRVAPPKDLIALKFWNPFNRGRNTEEAIATRRTREEGQSTSPPTFAYDDDQSARSATRNDKPQLQSILSSSGASSHIHDRQRRARSTSPISKYEAEKNLSRGREHHEYAERTAGEEQDAQRRAVRVADLEHLERKRGTQARLELEEKRRSESMERVMRRQHYEGFERVTARRRQDLEDIARRLDAAERARRPEEEEDQTYRRGEREGRRIEGMDRLRRVRRVNIPRHPRHEPAVNYESGSMEDRGERFIRDAIRRENLKQSERRAPPNDVPRRPRHEPAVGTRERKVNTQTTKVGEKVAPLTSLLDPETQRDGMVPRFEKNSDYDSLRDGADELLLLLRSDPELNALFTQTSSRPRTRERFVARFEMLLKIYGRDLKKEASDASHKAAATLVQIKARYVAMRIREAYEIPDRQDDELSELRSARVEAMPAEEGSEGEDPSPVSLESLKSFMITSEAFCDLRNAFHHMVYPDSLTAISDIIYKSFGSSEPYEKTESSTATFNVRWSLDDYVMTELSYDSELRKRKQLLDSVLVVVGRAVKAYATTAAKYMRWRWPHSNSDILRIVYSHINGDSPDTSASKISPEKPTIDIISQGMTDPAVVSFRVTGSLENIIEIAQQLAWITATFRVPVYGQVSYSSVLLSETGGMTFDLTPTPLEEVGRVINSSTCWLPLFANGIIARGLAVPARDGELGIELPFALMTSLANVMYPVFHADGVYLRSFSNLLFLTRISFDRKSVQWHLNTSAKAHSHLPHGTLPGTADGSEWAKCDDLERLASVPRTFLGCYRQVQVELGTSDSAERTGNITCSNADDEKPAPGLTPKSATTGFPGMGFWSFHLNMEFVLPKGLISTMEPGEYLDMLELAKDTPLIIYDNAEKKRRAWLVPQLGVVLHMAHIWAHDKTDLLHPIPSAASHWDAGEAAINVIRKHSKVPLREGLTEDKEYRLRDLIGQMLTSFDKVAEVEALARLEPGRTVKLGGSKLYGWELLDIVAGRKILFRKQVEISEDWMVLGANTIVLLCQNFGDIIQPSPHLRLCPTAKNLYQGQYQLTATIKCLQRLAEERCGSKDSACLRVANQAYWLAPSNGIFKDCAHGIDSTHGKPTKCAKIPQQILRNYVDPKAYRVLPIEGAVTFGKKRKQERIAAPAAPPPSTRYKAKHINGFAFELHGSRRGDGVANTTNNDGKLFPKATHGSHKKGSRFRGLMGKMADLLDGKEEKKQSSSPKQDMPSQQHAESIAHSVSPPLINDSPPVFELPDTRPEAETLQARRETLPDQGIQSSAKDDRKANAPRTRKANVTPLSSHQPASQVPNGSMDEIVERNLRRTIKAENLRELEAREPTRLDRPRRTRSEDGLRKPP